MKHSMTIMRAMIPACVWLRGEVQPAAAQHIITEIIGAGLRTPNGLNGSEGIAGILDDGLRLMPHSSAIDVGDNASLLR